jgi:hypothetical protein
MTVKAAIPTNKAVTRLMLRLLGALPLLTISPTTLWRKKCDTSRARFRSLRNDQMYRRNKSAALRGRMHARQSTHVSNRSWRAAIALLTRLVYKRSGLKNRRRPLNQHSVISVTPFFLDARLIHIKLRLSSVWVRRLPSMRFAARKGPVKV